MNTTTAFQPVTVWNNVSPGLSAELVDFWTRNGAIGDVDKATERARQAACIARDAAGAVCAVGTAFLYVLPRLRRPMYYYRQFFAPAFRGRRQTIPFFNHARQALEQYNASLDRPESIGVLVELESSLLATHYTRAHEPAADSTFIGYSPRGLQLRVSYFEGARLLAPAAPPPRRRIRH